MYDCIRTWTWTCTWGCRRDGCGENLASTFPYSLTTREYLRLPTAYFLLPTAHCPLPTAHRLLPTAYCLLPTAHCPLPTAHRLLPTAYCLLPIAYRLAKRFFPLFQPEGKMLVCIASRLILAMLLTMVELDLVAGEGAYACARAHACTHARAHICMARVHAHSHAARRAAQHA